MKLRENLAVKALAFTAAVAAFTATAIMGWYQLMNYDALWNGASSYDSLGYTSYYLLSQDQHSVRCLLSLYEQRDAGEELSLAEKRDIEQMEEQLAPQNTNLRWLLLRKDGTVLYGNTSEDGMDVNSKCYWSEYTLGKSIQPEVNIGWEYFREDTLRNAANAEEYDGVTHNNLWRSRLPGLAELARNEAGPEDGSAQTYRSVVDFESIEVTRHTALVDDDGYTKVLWVSFKGEEYVYLPTVQACLEPNQFGYIFDPADLNWTNSVESAAVDTREAVSLALWVDKEFPVDDQYHRAYQQLELWRSARTEYLTLTIVLGVAGALLMVYLCCSAGHKRGVEGICLNWFHRLPGDVLLLAMLLGGAGAIGAGIMAVYDAYMDAPMFIQLICIGTAVAVAAAPGLADLMHLPLC